MLVTELAEALTDNGTWAEMAAGPLPRYGSCCYYSSMPRKSWLTAAGALACAILLSAARPAAARPTAPHRRQALALFRHSEAAFHAGRFREAAALLRKAYALDPAPVLLYNLARALEGDGDLAGAVTAYAHYLEADPTAADHGAIERRIATLQQQQSDRERLAAARAAAERAQREAAARAIAAERAERDATARLRATAPARRPPLAPWIVAGLGGAALIAGAVFGGLTLSRHRAADEEPVQRAAVGLQHQANAFAVGANVAFAVGGALAVSGLVWGIVELVRRHETPRSVAFGVSRVETGRSGRALESVCAANLAPPVGLACWTVP